MKVTKKPKSIVLRITKHTYYRNVYDCPSCGAECHMAIDDYVTRFKCGCGQELIIKDRKE